MDNQSLYNDIKNRTNGEIYIGVVGPVRSGKSTFIRKFMDTLVIPNITDENEKIRTNDELPQSSAGKTVMTTEPKFIPKEAVTIAIDNVPMKIRMIDCVGYMITNATGHMEDSKERMVKTPWDDKPIPFTTAAHIGTNKVINNHSTVGIVITADGSFGDFNREDYIDAEEKTINQLNSIGKPYIILLNSANPDSVEAKNIAASMKLKYKKNVIPINCSRLDISNIANIINYLLEEFPIALVNFSIPRWVQVFECNEIMNMLINTAKEYIKNIKTVKECKENNFEPNKEYINSIKLERINCATGEAFVDINIYDKYYFNALSSLCNKEIKNEYQLINLLKELISKKEEYERVSEAVNMVGIQGYGVVKPNREIINIEKPQIIKNGNKYGISIKANANTIYMISTNINTEVSPIVGSKAQADDLMEYINKDDIWEVNILGKNIEQLISEGINDKIRNITDENMEKLKETLQKIMNDNSGIVCLIV